MADLIVENLILSVETHKSMDLQEISEAFSEAIFEPEKLPSVLFKYDNPSRMVFITTQGKLVCTGSKTKEQATEAISETIDLLKEKNFIDDSVSIMHKIESIVVSKNLNVSLPLERIESELPSDHCNYTKSKDPWLEYHQSTYSMLLFSSGNIVCTGNITLDESKVAFSHMEDILASMGCEITE
jgi:transcription initiation factor TFIID TATA-box-binding protein